MHTAVDSNTFLVISCQLHGFLLGMDNFFECFNFFFGIQVKPLLGLCWSKFVFWFYLSSSLSLFSLYFSLEKLKNILKVWGYEKGSKTIMHTREKKLKKNWNIQLKKQCTISKCNRPWKVNRNQKVSSIYFILSLSVTLFICQIPSFSRNISSLEISPESKSLLLAPNFKKNFITKWSAWANLHYFCNGDPKLESEVTSWVNNYILVFSPGIHLFFNC